MSCLEALRRLLLVALLLASPFLCRQMAVAQEDPSSEGGTSVADQSSVERIESVLLPNAYRVHAKVISGGQPAGEQAFQQLAMLGVRTLISVDGARPDAETARRYGLRYVHMPHGYDGIPTARAQELAKAVRDLEGPIYIHCHHGKHRSPAAAAVACVAAGLLQPRQALKVLEKAGTSHHYQGLYRSAAHVQPLDPELLDQLKVVYHETVQPPPVAEAMVELEHCFDRLQLIAKSGWRTPVQDPDLDPAHEALLLRELFTELRRMPEVKQQPAAFHEILRQSQEMAQELEDVLRSEQYVDLASAQIAAESLARIAERCTSCHRQYRDAALQNE